MKTLQQRNDVQMFVHKTRRDGILRSAAAKQLPAVLTRSGNLGWESMRTRFLACRDGDHRILIESPDIDAGDGATVLKPGERIGISFRRGRAKCLFNTTVAGPAPSPTGPVGSPAAVALQWPDQLQELQRRLFQRIETPRNRTYEVSIAAVDSDCPTASGRLTDLSAGGCGVAVDGLVTLINGDLIQLGLSFPPRSGRLVVPARVRHVAGGTEGVSRVGFQFLRLDTTADRQRTLALLAAVVADFRRAQLFRDRRHLPADTRKR